MMGRASRFFGDGSDGVNSIDEKLLLSSLSSVGESSSANRSSISKEYIIMGCLGKRNTHRSIKKQSSMIHNVQIKLYHKMMKMFGKIKSLQIGTNQQNEYTAEENFSKTDMHIGELKTNAVSHKAFE